MTLHDADRANRIKQFFDRHFRSEKDLHHLNVIRSLLPIERTDLRVLQAHCMTSARDAMHAGRHMKMQRFDHLARQLARLAG
jgi:hypothetical protein